MPPVRQAYPAEPVRLSPPTALTPRLRTPDGRRTRHRPGGRPLTARDRYWGPAEPAPGTTVPGPPWATPDEPPAACRTR